ncbi:MAG: hypothetical protein IKU81_07000 [Oscillibacter sp.]|nr:hypothetical protein [Oscillibacter sp.]
MSGAEEIVFEISGNAHRNCYEALRAAVEIAHEKLPVQLSMKELSAAVIPKLKGEIAVASVARALARATEDAWDNGGREVLQCKYGFRTKPTPKELIFRLARAMEPSGEYRILKDSTGKCGIVVSKPGEGYWMAVAPCLKDEDRLAAVIQQLNQAHMSIELFRELVFTDIVLPLVEGESDV